MKRSWSRLEMEWAIFLSPLLCFHNDIALFLSNAVIRSYFNPKCKIKIDLAPIWERLQQSCGDKTDKSKDKGLLANIVTFIDWKGEVRMMLAGADGVGMERGSEGMENEVLKATVLAESSGFPSLLLHFLILWNCWSLCKVSSAFPFLIYFYSIDLLRFSLCLTYFNFTMKNKKRKRKQKKNEEVSGQKAYTNTQKLNWNILTITDVFLDQKRVNVCEHMVTTVPPSIFPKLSRGSVFTMC